MRLVIRWALLALALALLAALALVLWKRDRGVHPFETGGDFAPLELGKTYRAFDLGVADVDGDERLDVFTVNHSNRQLLLLARGEMRFDERLVELGLSQCAEFPGAEAGLEQPALERPGLYIYWREELLVLTVNGGFEAAGRVELPRVLHHHVDEGATVRADGASLHFLLPGRGRLEIAADEFDFAPRIVLDETVALAATFVGPRCVNPERRDFRLPTQDRHAMAWCDFDGDGDRDVFVARGGGVGRLAELEPDARDEFFVFEGERFVDRTAEAGFEKIGCPARTVRWVDATGDGLLDLFVVCGRAEPPNADAPNQLFVQGPPGRFQERAAEFGLNTPGLGLAQWLDADRDGDADLFWASRSSVALFRSTEGRFHQELLAEAFGEAHQLSAADFDRDGDLDVFLASTLGNRLFRCVGASFEVVDPGSLGLPAQSFAASWVDQENDGFVDLHLLPQGLFSQAADGRFEATSLLAQRRSGIDALGAWFDGDGGGLRDYVVAVPDWTADARLRLAELGGGPQRFRPRTWRVLLYRNETRASNAWLQVELVGPPGNRAALGARVELHSATYFTAAEVGQSESSMRSQGHMRLYFGLGASAQGLRLRILWPDGSEQWIDAPAPNRLLRVPHGE